MLYNGIMYTLSDIVVLDLSNIVISDILYILSDILSLDLNAFTILNYFFK